MKVGLGSVDSMPSFRLSILQKADAATPAKLLPGKEAIVICAFLAALSSAKRVASILSTGLASVSKISMVLVEDT